MCILYVKLFVVFSQYFLEKSICLRFHNFFLCCFCFAGIYLYVLYLYDLFHILLLPLQTYGSVECMYVCKYVCVYIYCCR